MHRVTDSTLTVGGVPVDEFHPLEKTPPRRQLVVLADGTIAVTTLDQLQAQRAEWPTEADTDVYEHEGYEAGGIRGLASALLIYGGLFLIGAVVGTAIHFLGGGL